MTSHGSTTGLTAFFLALLTVILLTITGADDQTRDGGPVEARKGASGKDVDEAFARQRAHDLADDGRPKETRVRPDPKAIRDAFALQTRIANLLNMEGLVPEPWKEHFGTMSECEHTPITGRYGTILDVIPGRGGVVVTLAMGGVRLARRRAYFLMRAEVDADR